MTVQQLYDAARRTGGRLKKERERVFIEAPIVPIPPEVETTLA
jgi:hypothetical protein